MAIDPQLLTRLSDAATPAERDYVDRQTLRAYLAVIEQRYIGTIPATASMTEEDIEDEAAQACR